MFVYGWKWPSERRMVPSIPLQPSELSLSLREAYIERKSSNLVTNLLIVIMVSLMKKESTNTFVAQGSLINIKKFSVYISEN